VASSRASEAAGGLNGWVQEPDLLSLRYGWRADSGWSTGEWARRGAALIAITGRSYGIQPNAGTLRPRL